MGPIRGFGRGEAEEIVSGEVEIYFDRQLVLAVRSTHDGQSTEKIGSMYQYKYKYKARRCSAYVSDTLVYVDIVRPERSSVRSLP